MNFQKVIHIYLTRYGAGIAYRYAGDGVRVGRRLNLGPMMGVARDLASLLAPIAIFAAVALVLVTESGPQLPSKPAIGDTLQACFLECANDKRCNNVFVEYMNINYMEKPPPANCTLLGPLQDPSTGCKRVTNASLGPGGTLIAALPGARSRATDWPGAMPPLVAGVEGYALKTDDHLDAQEVALSGPAWSGPSASLVRDASGQMRIVVDGQILSPSSRYHTGAKLETMVRAGANEIC